MVLLLPIRHRFVRKLKDGFLYWAFNVRAIFLCTYAIQMSFFFQFKRAQGVLKLTMFGNLPLVGLRDRVLPLFLPATV